MKRINLTLLFGLVAGLVAFGVGSAAATTAEAAPTLSISPDHFAFGPINVGGELGEPGEFTLENPGPGPVQLDDALLEGEDAGSFKLLPNGSTCWFLEPAGLIPAGGSCTVVAIFDPESEGPKQASLKITSDSVTSPDSLPLTGTGMPRMLPGATLSPQALDFGARLVGESSEPATFELLSSGTGALEIRSVGLSGPDRDQFTLVRNGCTQVEMASGDRCSIEVAFSPTSAGSRSATLIVQTDAEGADTTVKVTGTGTRKQAPGSRVRIGRLPRLHGSNFQKVPVRCSTTGMDDCRGRLVLFARGRDLGFDHRHRVRVGGARFRLAPGHHEIRVRLTRSARRAVERRGLLRVRVVAVSRQADGRFHSTRSNRTIRR